MQIMFWKLVYRWYDIKGGGFRLARHPLHTIRDAIVVLEVRLWIIW